MKNTLSHFAIYIDDIDRARDFYSNLFGWSFNQYGPGDFLQIKLDESDESAPIGALQARKYAPIEEKINGFECSIAVENIDQIAKLVSEQGGRIVMPKTAIPFVGWLIKFLDTEGNIVCAMQYDRSAK